MHPNFLFDQLCDGWWSLPCGARNLISDVEGVKVGHITMTDGSARTGVTAVLAHSGDLFNDKVEAGAAVLNGFGKSVGLVQLQELGQIETPIILSNTFAMPVCATALIKRAMKDNPEIGRTLPTVNALALECNDGQLNDIQAMHVTERDVYAAIDVANAEFELGSVGAGTGMKTFGFAGGLGSASRLVKIDDTENTLGALVLSNFGQQSELRFCGRRMIGTNESVEQPDKGSIIVVLATDAAVDSRQLKRIAKRASAALGRTGSYLGHGSGDIAVAFSTAKADSQRLEEPMLDRLFLAAVEATEEAIYRAMWHGESRAGYDGNQLPSFRKFLEES